MTDEQLLKVAILVAALQVTAQAIGLLKSIFEWRTARQKAKAPTRRKRVEASDKKHRNRK